ncbi:type IV pilin protein [Duganella callida]|uniref:Prepilin-type N-terminal cleavage/methylation domain-containing protein n=1 Tax=Duganella callida TaxID=2561932 RepID=A0A4Y9ST39_9BURK|nr:type IV pilin protein [Duganella callida]TFW29635.1 prepilin-type N-terminal cleavage/methylation domain-containing protein [Duganella callida]
MQRHARGFTLIEVMITVAIVSILLAVAIPAYSDYVTRGRLSEAFTALGGAQPAAEQYWSNNRSYANFDGSPNFPKATPNFTYALSNASASTYTITATGTNKMSGFVYSINESGTHATVATPAGWGANANCWVDHKGGACSN